MSTFNPEDFMNETIEGEMDTAIIPVPKGEYAAQIEKVDIREVDGRDGKKAYPMDVTYAVLDDAVRELTGREKPTVRQSIWLDLDPATGRIDASKGKNVGLGKLRAAADMNKPGEKFVPNQLIGAMVKITVDHRADPRDSSIIYAEVKKVGTA
jgi:hypothetical protein